MLKDKKHVIIIVLLLFIIFLLLLFYFMKKKESFNSSEKVNDTKKKNDCNLPKLVLYYTDWCGYSMKFKPIFDKFSCENNLNIRTEAIDCEQNKMVCEKYDLKGFPEV